ncbi:MAG TPA: beta-ketoacyl synthase N-terminal-like domain-containing protein, partial [Thermoanaerobaculia bacterium]|nr:beta-ketoacyl synthase N-terminal-like domain-containing protein [Thermoanaerobaculia bacterium]
LVPAALVVLAALPLTANGKIDRAALPPPAAERAALATPYAAPSGEIEEIVGTIWRRVLGREEVGADDNFFDLGGHSLLLARLQLELVAALGTEVPMATLFEFPSLRTLASHLGQRLAPPAAAAPAPTRRAAVAGGGDVAIVAMVGRMPAAADLEELWRNLCRGEEAITFFTDEELLAAGVPAERLADPRYVKARGVLAGIDQFDAGFFHFSPREAELLDPQHRIFLEASWTLLEEAGYHPEGFGGRIGVYAGSSTSAYSIGLLSSPELMGTVGEFSAAILSGGFSLPTLASYKLNLEGPSVFLSTACSTSLVAVHMACQALRTGDADMALAGGVAATTPQVAGHVYQPDGAFSPDGHCRPFDAAASGTVAGSGLALVLLKRLEDALAARDTIRGVIKGTAINNDGAVKLGYSAPGVRGQVKVIRQALADAGVEPATIGYVEAHGTGTPLGDPIEVAALDQVYRAATDRTGFCALGSLKSNLGHLDSAAGAAGLIKAALCLERRQLVPSLHFHAPNPKLDLAASAFFVNAELRDWPAGATPRRAAVSAFGIGGTNAHVVLEEAPPPEPGSASRATQLLVLSARSPAALEAATDRLAAHLLTLDDDPRGLADAAFTLQVGRRAMAHRRAVACANAREGASALERRDPLRVVTASPAASPAEVIFMFPGGGAQYAGMGGELYRDEEVYRREVDRCAELLLPHLGEDVRAWLRPPGAGQPADAGRMRRTAIALPALFVAEYALAQLLAAWGVQPAAMIGHSLGEYVAACLAGVFSLADALALVALRGRLIETLPDGSLLSVPLGEEEIRPWLGDRLWVAALNAPGLSLVSGLAADVERAERELRAHGIEAHRLELVAPAHSPLIEPILDEFRSRVSQLSLRPPAIPYLSNVSGDWILPEQATDPEHWVRHLRQTVRFGDGMTELLAEPRRVFVEVGPGQTLSKLAERCAAPARPVTVSTMRPPQLAQPDLVPLLRAVGRLWAAGVEIDWPAFCSAERRRRVRLPTYPFERRRYWLETRFDGVAAPPAAAAAQAWPEQPSAAAAAPDAAVRRGGIYPRPELGNPYLEPRDEIERRLAALWGEALGIGEIGIDDNFFAAGGDSILAVRYRSRIAEQFDVEIPIAVFFERPTVRSLGEY